MTKAAPVKADDNIKRVAFTGFAIIFVAFGAVGGWAATAPLASAVIGNGVIAAESNRKTVQHFEGGIIKTLLPGPCSTKGGNSRNVDNHWKDRLDCIARESSN
jgi:hypothetical protein